MKDLTDAKPHHRPMSDNADVLKAQQRIGRPIPVFYPSHDGRSMHSTIQTINMMSVSLHRPLWTTSTGGIGQAVAMNGMVLNFKNTLKKFGMENMIEKRDIGDGKTADVFRVLWIEDDIILDQRQAVEIGQMITKADENGWNIVAPYTTGFRDGGEFNWVYFYLPNKETGEIGRPFTEDEIRALKPYDPLNGLAGLGFYYGDLYLDYVWYEGTYNGRDRFGLPSYSGIDWNYFLDNKVALRHYPLLISHEKPVQFGNRRVIRYWGDHTEWAETSPRDPLVGVITSRAEKKRAANRRRKVIVS